MAAGNWTPYTQALLNTFDGAINWTSANIRCVLVSSSYTPAPNTDATWANVSAYQVTGTGYTAGGTAVTTPAVAASAATVTASCASIPSWTGATITAQYAILVLSTGGATPASTDKLLAFVNLSTSGSVVISAGTLAVSGYSVAITHTP